MPATEVYTLVTWTSECRQPTTVWQLYFLFTRDVAWAGPPRWHDKQATGWTTEGGFRCFLDRDKKCSLLQTIRAGSFGTSSHLFNRRWHGRNVANNTARKGWAGIRPCLYSVSHKNYFFPPVCSIVTPRTQPCRIYVYFLLALFLFITNKIYS